MAKVLSIIIRAQPPNPAIPARLVPKPQHRVNLPPSVAATATARLSHGPFRPSAAFASWPELVGLFGQWWKKREIPHDVEPDDWGVQDGSPPSYNRRKTAGPTRGLSLTEFDSAIEEMEDQMEELSAYRCYSEHAVGLGAGRLTIPR
ncbi:hypothetical protein BU16DRAFT_568253 [Lophium mytilinum]|uniref:Uncharacterized protein n=1 Tax=Lophium mytilinum TaxID=390894 RepID=A0A6A6Q7V4_9PEZI|nr:hypothetical protein BU16DRAFT_568253 [Lophium mytilinum]